MISPNIQISHELFPLVYQDIETGAFVAEILVPPKTPDDSKKVQVLLDSHIVESISGNEEGLLSRIAWLSGRDSILSINPSIAFIEQFLSNPSNVQTKMKNFEDRFVPLGIYERGFSIKFHEVLLKNEETLRRELANLFCYVALIFHWEKNVQKNNESIDKWIQLFSKDIPRLQVFYLLGGLFAVSGLHKNLRLKSNEKRIDSYRQTFCSERKEEQNNLSRRLRNRSFDLLFFYQAHKLVLPSDGGYKSRILLVTKDKFLGEILCQLFCWAETEEGSLWGLKFIEAKLRHENETSASLTKSLMNGLSQGRPNSGEDDVRKRLNNLIGLTLNTVDNDMKAALKNSLKEFNITYDE